MSQRALPLVVLLSACGNVSVLDNNLAPLPTITSFAAAPAAFDADGGTSVLSWEVVNQDALSLQPGGHDVTGFTSAEVVLTATTLYTLSASNPLGVVTSTLTVTVGP
jgi:hypothetical protein